MFAKSRERIFTKNYIMRGLLNSLIKYDFIMHFVLLTIIITITIISFIHGIYTYIPDTNYVAREYSVAAILLLLFTVLISLVPVLNLLYFYISTFRSVCAVPNVAVCCSSLTSSLHYYYYYYYYITVCWPHGLCYSVAPENTCNCVDKKNQLDDTFCILYFSSNSCSTCFGQPCAHHQELTTA